MNIFWSSNNKESLKQYLEVMQDSGYLLASFLLSRQTQDPNFVKDDKYKNSTIFQISEPNDNFLKYPPFSPKNLFVWNLNIFVT